MKRLFPVIIMLIPLLMFAEQTTIGYFGILSETVSDVMITALDIEHGVVVTKVYDGTPAEKTGFEVGDVIYEIDGEAIKDIDVLKSVIAERPNKKVEVKILRSGKHMKKSVTLGEKEEEVLKFKFDIPDMDDFKKAFEMGRAEFKEEIQNLEKEIELLKKEIEEIKRQLQEQ